MLLSLIFMSPIVRTQKLHQHSQMFQVGMRMEQESKLFYFIN